MTHEPEYERPNTVAGLIAKHAELTKLRVRYQAEIKRLIADIAHLDAAIRLFDPDADTYEMKQHVTRQRSHKGSVKRFILDTFREATEPLTSRQITLKWIEHNGLSVDEKGYAVQRKKIAPSIGTCAAQGLIESVGWSDPKGVNGSYKLWALKKGGQ